MNNMHLNRHNTYYRSISFQQKVVCLSLLTQRVIPRVILNVPIRHLLFLHKNCTNIILNIRTIITDFLLDHLESTWTKRYSLHLLAAVALACACCWFGNRLVSDNLERHKHNYITFTQHQRVMQNRTNSERKRQRLITCKHNSLTPFQPL